MPRPSGLQYKAKRTDAEWYRLLPTLEPGQVGIRSTKKAWFICENGHRRLVRPNLEGKGCKVCYPARIISDDEWYRRLPDLDPGQKNIRGRQKFWFTCGKGHRYETLPDNRMAGRGCPLYPCNPMGAKPAITKPFPSAPSILEPLAAIPVTPRYSFLVLATEIMIDAQI